MQLSLGLSLSSPGRGAALLPPEAPTLSAITPYLAMAGTGDTAGRSAAEFTVPAVPAGFDLWWSAGLSYTDGADRLNAGLEPCARISATTWRAISHGSGNTFHHMAPGATNTFYVYLRRISNDQVSLPSNGRNYPATSLPAAVAAPAIVGGEGALTITPATGAAGTFDVIGHDWQVALASDLTTIIASGTAATAAPFAVSLPAGEYRARTRPRSGLGVPAWSPWAAAQTVTALTSAQIVAVAGGVEIFGDIVSVGDVWEVTVTSPAGYAGLWTASEAAVTAAPTFATPPVGWQQFSFTGDGNTVGDVVSALPTLVFYDADQASYPPPVTVEWLRNGSPIPASAGSYSYTLTELDIGIGIGIRENVLDYSGATPTSRVADFRSTPTLIGFTAGGANRALIPAQSGSAGRPPIAGEVMLFATRFRFAATGASQRLFHSLGDAGGVTVGSTGSLSVRSKTSTTASLLYNVSTTGGLGNLVDNQWYSLLYAFNSAGWNGLTTNETMVIVNGTVFTVNQTHANTTVESRLSYLCNHDQNGDFFQGVIEQMIWQHHPLRSQVASLDPATLYAALFDAANGHRVRETLGAANGLAAGLAPHMFLWGAASFIDGTNFGSQGGSVTPIGGSLQAVLAS